MDAVGAALTAVLKPADQEPLLNGSPRWRDRVHHARLRLMAQGFIVKDSPWGIWTIIEQGRQALLDGGDGGQRDE